jgi:hypothetical protein
LIGEEGLINVGKKIFELLGYKVVGTSSPEETLEIFKD